MNEQEVPVAEGARRRAMPAVLLVVILVAAAAAAYVAVTVLRPPRVDPVALIPKDVAVAITFDLSKSQDKDAAIKVITDIFEKCGVKDPVNEMFKSIDKELGIKVETDVLPKLNGLGAVAVLPEMMGFAPSAAVIVGARNEKAASELLQFAVGKLRAHKVKLHKLNYEGFTYYRISQELPVGQMAFYVGAVKNAVVGTLGESAFKKAADTTKGKPSLLDEPNYARLRGTSQATFATAYFSGPNYYKLIGPFMSMGVGMAAPDATEMIKESLESVVAVVGTADASADGIKLVVNGVGKKAAPTVREVAVEDLAAVAPKDAAIVIASQGFDLIWAEAKKELQAAPGLKAQIDEILAQVRQMLKIDPFADALDRIKSFGVYYVPKAVPDPQSFPGSLVFVVGVDKPEAITRTLGRIHQAASSMGKIKFAGASAGGLKGAVSTIDEYGTRLWDVLSGDKLLVGITGGEPKEGMEDAVAAARGKRAAASSSAGFELVKKRLPARSAYLAYGDMGAIVNAFKSQMSEEDRKIADAITKTVGTFGAAGTQRGKESQLVLVVPFRK